MRNNNLTRFFALFLSIAMLMTAMPVMAQEDIYVSDYASKAEALAAGLALNEEIAQEGMILLKNEGAALPLAEGAKVTLLGYAALAPNAGASANGGDASAGAAIAQADVISSLTDYGFALNETVLSAYKQWATEVVPGTETAEKPVLKANDRAMAADFAAASETEEWKASVAEYADAALVVLGKGTSPLGEGRVHNLQLDAEQFALIDYAAANFEKVIVLVNSCTPIEMAAIQNNEKVDAILNIGEPGDNGFKALGAVLCGIVNPSARTTDTWAVDFTQNPSYVNFNTLGVANAQGTDGNGTMTGYTQYKVNGEMVNTWSVGYEEGIYVGYRYYETRAFEEAKAGNEGWWAENVVYPFGYGLSYTDFTWEVKPATEAGATITKDDKLVFDVTVTNNGTVAGKDVVELYVTAPYGTEATGNQTVIEKAHVVLADFAKTGIIEPGESETVQVAVNAADMASYDNVTDKTYVLDAGVYGLKIARNAHDIVSTTEYTVAEKALCNVAATGAEITNQLDDVTDGFTAEGYTALSRADFAGTMPDSFVPVKEITEEEYKTWGYDAAAYRAKYNVETAPVVGDASKRTEAKYSLQLSDLIGAEADDPRFQELVEQMTLAEMVQMINIAGFNSAGNEYIGKPFSRDTDGPKGWTGNYTDANDRFNYFSSEPMIAATWNTDLLYRMGQLIGEQGIWGNSTASGIVHSYTGWYAPGMNIHRSVFDGRYTEYYSEDPVLTGAMATNVSLGAKSKGCYVTLKHFAFHNDGGGVMTYRCGPIGGGTAQDGLSVWVSEQAAREVYLKGYQMAVEEGKATFAMGSFTRIGKTWCGGSYAINNAITRGEWGFNGAIVTDIVFYNAVNAYQLIMSGANMMLDAKAYGLPGGVFLDEAEIMAMDEAERNVTIYAMQQAVKQILFMVANSNAMQVPKGAKVQYNTVIEIDDEEVDLVLPVGKVGEAYTSVKIDNATLNTYYAYAPITYTVNGVPAGMTYADGVITGTPETAGEYNIEIVAEAEGYESATVTLPLVIAE